jgi:hypothetical protein
VVDDFSFCHDLSVAECQVVGCARLRGVLEDDHCGERGVDSAPLACAPADALCDDALTCAVRPDDGARFTFPSTCIPRGWAPRTLCEDFEFCETEESEFEVCVDEAPADDACDAFLAVYSERRQAIVAATNPCTIDLDCTTEVVRFVCGAGEVFLQGCSVPVAHDLACEYRQAIEDLEIELCTGACVPECSVVAACPGPTPVACVDGRCAFAP